MNDTEENRCKRCGAVVPGQSTERLCPACLMSEAMELSDDGIETMPMGPAAPLSLGRPEDFPCVLGDYRLLGLLGRGGMGTVYEAEHLTTGRRVALKMLGHQLDSPEMRQRFLREGRLAAGVNHPNSLYVFGSEEVEGLPVITMEIAGGGTLKDLLDKRGPLPVPKAVDAILDVIAGLESAFAAGVLHRDIKPSNCFVGPNGSVKVGDFGLSVSTLARTDTFVTAQGRIMGTPAYASPEQLRGDTLDVRADIYSVSATLYTLLTDRAPFEGDNAVQVVANAVNQKPKPLSEFRNDVPPALERVVARCLAKDPQGRYANYAALRNALLPFSSKEPSPASMKVRGSAGWIDYLLAFLPAYVILMLLAGGEKLLIRPLAERTLYSARYYFLLFGIGFLYFAVTEGIWGAGLGKKLKGLRVVGTNGRPPGIVRALVRVVIPIASIEAIRNPLLIALIPDFDRMSGSDVAILVLVTNVCAWIPVLLAIRAHRQNGFATLWDRLTGTRVVKKPQGAVRPSIETASEQRRPTENGDSLGPYRVFEEMIPGQWLVASDPVLRRRVWLWRRESPDLPPARRNLARPGRLRWLQKVETPQAIWDAFEAPEGRPLSDVIEANERLPWDDLRFWLYDLAAEMWEATSDPTLPAELSIDHIWITAQGRAILLERPWPNVATPAETTAVSDLAGQQRFLSLVADCAETSTLPLHARAVLRNLGEGKFEKLSFLAGHLRSLLDRPVEVGRALRAGAIFMLPLYVWITIYIGYYHGGDAPQRYTSPIERVIFPAMVVLGAIALAQVFELALFATTASDAIFRLAVVDAGGKRAKASRLLKRWAIIWLPLLLPMASLAYLSARHHWSAAPVIALGWLLAWLAAAVHAAIHPSSGLHDRLAGTCVVRR